MAFNANVEVKKFLSAGDKVSSRITTFAGSIYFVLLNALWFSIWLLTNTGTFGEDRKFDEFPFGFLTLAVSLEAIFLSIFVLISQNRQAKLAEIRSELDYRTDLQSEVEVEVIVSILQRLAKNQNIDVSDLMKNLKIDNAKVLTDHPVENDTP